MTDKNYKTLPNGNIRIFCDICDSDYVDLKKLDCKEPYYVCTMCRDNAEEDKRELEDDNINLDDNNVVDAGNL